jgi:hypothetical protein
MQGDRWQQDRWLNIPSGSCGHMEEVPPTEPPPEVDPTLEDSWPIEYKNDDGAGDCLGHSTKSRNRLSRTEAASWIG